MIPFRLNLVRRAFGWDCEQAYSKLPTEADPDTAPGIITKDWPQNGEIEFVHYTMAYRDDLPAVLNDLCFKVSEAHEHSLLIIKTLKICHIKGCQSSFGSRAVF